MTVRDAFPLAAVLLLACGGAAAPEEAAAPPTSAPAVVTLEGPEQIRQALGKPVRIEGTAANAKLSAVVVRGDLTIYCLDHPAWPDEVVRKRVVVDGTLEYTEQFAAKPSPDGAISAGTTGGVYALRPCRYRLTD